ncbi:MAG: glycogen debranching enzyme GlgX [Spirochaetaceae bacterium]|nr:MAG: glycogen debranching enzyme GlgX [Spirochaetaceae bacterium]
MEIRPGKPYPLGARYDGAGTNISLFSEVAESVELCLFDEHGRETRHTLPEVTGHCWHGYVPNLIPGQHYGFRVHGPWEPGLGSICNPAKLLLDPYAKAIAGDVSWNPAVFAFDGESGKPEPTDSAPFVPKSVVTNPFFDWSDDSAPRVAWNDTVIYEVHVKGFSIVNPDIPTELRGTYSALAHPASIDYFRRLGITALELMPVHQFIHDGHLLDKGLRNYWGYNTIGFFAPHSEYAARETAAVQVAEFKQMVKTLHKAGIEVILDVVYNHTAEGNHKGPTLCFRGIDNGAYYRLSSDDPRYYVDYTGTGNSLNMRHPHVLQLIMDSLRYWILEMHVDGFRFDLASTLARELHDVDRLSAFFDIIQQDPVISQVKLIAEPWDVGEGGYQVGNFPPGWSEWNGKYRDCIRDFWRGEGHTLAEFAYRFTGSSDLYENTGRRPYASINFVTCHDGFTLTDLVSYNDKRNDANGESNRDGESHNRSWNCGVEGPTDDPDIIALRDRQKRNLLVTLMLSQGVPMVAAGDEIGRSALGNNNTYCQDNELSWIDWQSADDRLLDFARRLIAFRREHPVFRRRHWFQGQAVYGRGLEDICWLTPAGIEMEDDYWKEGHARSIAIFLNGSAVPTPDAYGRRVVDNSFYVIINAHHEPLEFTMPGKEWGRKWRIAIDTTAGFSNDQATIDPGEQVPTESRSIIVLQSEGDPERTTARSSIPKVRSA